MENIKQQIKVSINNSRVDNEPAGFSFIFKILPERDSFIKTRPLIPGFELSFMSGLRDKLGQQYLVYLSRYAN
jgi:hypothetical protein